MRFKRSISIGLVFILIATVLATLSITNTTAAPPTSGDWLIDASQNEVVDNVNIQMTGNITVNSLGKLTIRNSTITFLMTQNNQYGITINTGGTVVLENCVIESNNTNYRYWFFVNTDSDFNMRYCTVTDVEDGIHILTNVAKVTGCYIRNCDDGLEIVDSNAEIKWNYIYSNDHRGIYIRSPGGTPTSPTIEGNQIYSNMMYGIYIDDSAPYIFNNEIYSNRNPGIRVQDCSSTFQISANSIRYNLGYGIHIERSKPILSQNIIEANSGAGIWVWGDGTTVAEPIINTNTIIGNGGSGIYLDNEYCGLSTQDIQIESNNIYNNRGWGIYARGAYFAETSTDFDDARGIGNRNGRVIQLWHLQVHETVPDDAGFYLFNDKIWTNPVFSGNGYTSYNFGYRGEYEISNDGTTYTYSNYYIIADNTGGPEQDYASFTLNNNMDIAMTLAPAPELEIDDLDWSDPNPNVGDTVTVTIDVRNNGGLAVNNVDVDVYIRYPDGDYKFATRIQAANAPIGTYPANIAQINTDITFQNAGGYEITAIVDPDNDYWEDDDTDNPPTNARTEGINVAGASAFINDIETYTDHPYWAWRSMSEQDSASTDPGQWRTFEVQASKYGGLQDRLLIQETHNNAWDVKISYSGSSSTTNLIPDLDMWSWQTNEWFYIHVRPPTDAPRGSNLNMDLTLVSENYTAAQESFDLDCYVNWIIPADTTETVTGETIADMQYQVKVWGDLDVSSSDWTFNNYPQQQEISIFDGGKATFDDMTITSTDPAFHWRFYVYGDMELTDSDISENDYGIEVYTQDYPANVLIDGCTIHDSNHDGITLDESYAIISNNVIENNQHSGIDGDDAYGNAYIIGNTLRYNDEGIYMRLKSEYRVNAYNNTIYGNTEGIVLDSFTEINTYNNLIYGNTYGIRTYNHADLYSENDVLKMNSNDGINMDSYSTATLVDCSDSYNGRAGIWLTYNAKIDVSDSNVEKNGQFALYATNSDAVVTDSTLTNTAVHGSYNNNDNIMLDWDAHVVVTNVSLDDNRIYINDDNSTLTKQWYLQIQTIDMYGGGVDDVHVEVLDGLDNVVFDGLTEDDGLTPVIISKEITLYNPGNIDYKNHEVSVSNGLDIEQSFVFDFNMIEVIILNYAVKVTPMENEIRADPDTLVTFNFIVANIGLLDDTYDITVAGNISYRAALGKTTIALAAGETTNLTLNLTVPLTVIAYVNETFVVSATSQNDPAAIDAPSVYYRANAFRGIKIVPVHETFNSTPGNNFFSAFEVSNLGNVQPDGYDFSASVQGTRLNDPTITVTPADADMVEWETITVLVNVSVANGTLTGIDQLTLEAVNKDFVNNQISEEATVSLLVDQVFVVDIDRPEAIEIVAGDSDTYDVNITNIGNGPDIVKITSDSEYLSFDMDLIPMQPLEAVDFQMTVTIPLDMDTTVMVVNIIAECADNLTFYYFNLTLNIAARIHGLEIVTPFDTIDLEQGFLKTFTVTLDNEGNTWETAVLTYSGVSWTGAFDEDTLIILLGGTADTGFTLQVPEGFPVGEQELLLTATYAGAVATKTITINVIEKDVEFVWSEVPGQDPVIRGEYRTIKLTLTNTGNYTTTAYLSIVERSALSTLDIYIVTLAPGGSQEITLKITFPEDFEPDTYDVQVIATYGYNNTKSANAAVELDVETAWAGTIALIIIMLLLGIIIGALVLFFLAKQGLLPGVAKKDEDEEKDGEEGDGLKKVKKKVKKKKIQAGPAMEGGEMPLGEGELPPGVTVGEDGELVYSEEEQMSPDEMLDQQEGGEGLLPEEEMDIKDEISALAEEEGVVDSVEEEIETMDELDADIQAMIEQEDTDPVMQEMEPMEEETNVDDVDVTLPEE